MANPFEPGEPGGIPSNPFDGAGEARMMGADGPLAQQGEAAGDFMKRQGSDAPTWKGIVGPDHTQAGIVGPDHTRAGIGGAGGNDTTGKASRKSGLGRVGVIALVLALLIGAGGGALAMRSAGVFGCQNNLHSAGAGQVVASMSFAVDSPCGADSQASLSGGASTSSTPTPTAAATTAATTTTAPTATTTPHSTATPRPTIIKFSLSSVSYKQSCNKSTASLLHWSVTLNNSASTVSVKWSATASTLSGSSTPWAQLQPSSGTIAAGSVTTLTITPIKSICGLLINQNASSGTYYVTISVPSASPTSYKITDSVTV